mgnify:CR=1 FL=1
MKLPKNFEDIDGMGDRSRGPIIPGRPDFGAATPWHPWSPSRAKVIKQGPAGVEGGTMIQSPTKPSNFVVTEVRRSSGIPPTWVGYHRKSAGPGPYINPDGIIRASAGPHGPWRPPAPLWPKAKKGPYGPWKPVPEFGQFDGGAVKKNWIPLVVLGMSLAVGIGISEWASKKYIK